MIVDKNRIYDGWLTLEGGVDAGRQPNTIDPNQCRSAINMTFRGGSASTRPGFRKLDEKFPPAYFYSHEWKTKQEWCYANQHGIFRKGEYKQDSEVLFFQSEPPPPPPPAPPPGVLPWFLNQNSEYIYRNGIFQSACAYSPHNGDDCIMAMIGGRLFKIIPRTTTAKVHEIEVENVIEAMRNNVPHNVRNNGLRPIAYMTQADKWMLVQDGYSSAIIYDNSKARRSNTTGNFDETEIPVGTIMAYGMGRIVVVVNDRDVAFGDLYGSHDLPDPADSLLLFTERNFLAEGFDAAIPFSQGVATGMVFFPQLDTSTGNGQLMVFAERGSASFFLSLPREEWKTSTFQILSLLTTGLRGHRTISAVNEDLWFRSDDGVRSYRQARSEQGGWAHIPLSTNVRQFLENDSDFLLKYASSIYFDNRIIMTTSPVWNNGRPCHAGVVVVDFDVISSFGGSIQAPQANKPAWEGQWKSSRFNPIQLLTGTFDGMTRAFCFGLDSNGQNQLYELSVDDRDDWDGERIPFELITRTLDFQKLDPSQSSQFTENELYDADVWLRDIVE